MTIDIRPMIEDVSQVMTKHITSILSGVIGEYTIYKETHDTIMGLPCVRKLQERISELEQHCGGGEGGCGASMSASSMTTNTGGGSREEEVAQLQSAIADLNRYIHALESKVDMKSVSSGDGGHIQQQHHHHDEESVRLEIHETDDGDEGEGDDDHCESTVETLSTHKNVIITTEALEETETEAEAEADAEAAEQEEAEADAEAAEQEEAEQEEAEEEAEEEDAEEAEADAEAEDAEADAEAEDAEDAEAQPEPEPEAEEAEADAEAEDADAEAEDAEADAEAEEVEEVKIKGKTYFTTNPQNGIIYACVDDDVGDEVGVFKNGVAVFNKGKK